MHILKTSFHQNSHVGLYAFANDHYCLASSMIQQKMEKDLMEVLKVPIIWTNLCGSALNGIFAVGNNKCLLLPQIVLDAELAHLDHHKIKYKVISTDHTALANNMVANDEAALISPDLKNRQEEIKTALGVKKIQTFTINQMSTIGSLIVLGHKGILISKFASDEEAAFVEKFFNLPVTRGSVNLGSPYVSSGLVVNKHGFIVGERTGGPETVHIDEALGFLKQ